ncbi:hypothetical protein V5799_033858 [Amblyomma americanum]|uniref:Uncharacterized protein n=1 Tax=Amblyomma americanum TaxID=6943 RepID=A0AAQ4DM42_AMBAM
MSTASLIPSSKKKNGALKPDRLSPIKHSEGRVLEACSAEREQATYWSTARAPRETAAIACSSRMTANMRTVAALLLCAAIVNAQERGRFGTCTFPGVDLEPVVDALLKRLPESYNLADAVPRDVLPGLRVGNTTLVGLSKLELQGAPRLFCRRGKAMLEISTHGFAQFSAPWR